jgi:hypothetical protein
MSLIISARLASLLPYGAIVARVGVTALAHSQIFSRLALTISKCVSGPTFQNKARSLNWSTYTSRILLLSMIANAVFMIGQTKPLSIACRLALLIYQGNCLKYSTVPRGAHSSLAPAAPPQTGNFEHIPFNQNTIIKKIDKKNHPALFQINAKHKGLCDLICNIIIMYDMLGDCDPDSIKNQLTLDYLSDPSVTGSHLLKVYSIREKAYSFLFDTYPNNLLSPADQELLLQSSQKGNKINRPVLAHGLQTLGVEEYLKVEVFSKSWFDFTGHSVLIKKLSSSSYIFFDPNTGEDRHISVDELSDRLDSQLKSNEGTHLLMIKAQDFFPRLPKPKG